MFQPGPVMHATGFWGRLRAKEVYHGCAARRKKPRAEVRGSVALDAALSKDLAVPGTKRPSLAQVRAPGERWTVSFCLCL